MKYRGSFKSENGTETAFQVETSCSVQEDLERSLQFIAQSVRRFYPEAGKAMNEQLEKDKLTIGQEAASTCLPDRNAWSSCGRRDPFNEQPGERAAVYHHRRKTRPDRKKHSVQGAAEAWLQSAGDARAKIHTPGHGVTVQDR